MNDSKVMMSEELQGLVPDLEEGGFDHGSNSVVHLEISGRRDPFYGPLVGFSCSNRLKVELKTTPDKALEIYRNKDAVVFDRIKIIYRNESLSFDGPLKVHKVRVRDVRQKSQVCTLRLSFIPIVKE